MDAQEKRRTSSGHRRRKRVRLAGKIFAVVQLILSVLLLYFAAQTGLLGTLYTVLLAVGLLALFGLTFGLQFVRRKMWLNIVAMVVSIVLSVGIGFGGYYVMKTNHMMDDIGGATLKIDNMVVLVRAEDQAQELLDVKDYQFGRQTAVDQENTQTMIDSINGMLSDDISIATYDTLEELAQALLDGRIEAAILNQALIDVVDETVSGFSEQVRVVYTYGIETQVQVEAPREVNNSFNVYISGIDVAGAIGTTSRSDVNIIATVNPDSKTVLLTTTPRDYFVPFPGVSGGRRDKLTHAGLYGVETSIATLETLYNIKIDYYARVNFTTLIQVVDLLGGVDVNSQYEFSAGGYHFVKGINHLNGAQALAFSRERYSFADGDNQRGKNQELVLAAIIQRALSPDILMNADELIASVSQSFETNMSKEQISKLIRMQLLDHAKWEIRTLAATGTGSYEYSYTYPRQKLYVMYPNESSVASISQAIEQVEAEKE